jgi:UDP-3-O-[3-hydroxymyristoyl] glucosamine N-acyltransferase
MASDFEITVGELAQRIGGVVRGNASLIIRGIGTLEEAGPDMLSWIAAQRLLARLEQSSAGAVLMPLDCEPPAGCTAICVRDPELVLCDLLSWLGPPVETVPTGVHQSAVIAPDAQVQGAAIGPLVTVGPRSRIGARTQLHAGVRIGSDVVIGSDCVLWPNVVVRERVSIGQRVIIHPNATIGADGFGYLQRGGQHRKIPQMGTVIIEDDVEVGAATCIDRARTGATRIGRGTKIDNLVQLAHNVSVGEGCIIVAQCGISGSTVLGRHVVFGGQVGVIDHQRVGDRVQVAAKSAVMNDIPADAVYRGIPAREQWQFGRQEVALRRLPKMIEQLRELAQRVERLESATHDRAGS